MRPHLGDVIVATGQKPRNGDEAQMALEHCATLADYTTPNSPGSLARAPWVRHLWVPERIRRSHRIMRSRPRAEIGTLILCCFHHMGILPRGVLIYYLDDHGFLFFLFFFILACFTISKFEATTCALSFEHLSLGVLAFFVL